MDNKCPKCNDKDYYGYYKKGIIIKKYCLKCGYESKDER